MPSKGLYTYYVIQFFDLKLSWGEIVSDKIHLHFHVWQFERFFLTKIIIQYSSHLLWINFENNYILKSEYSFHSLIIDQQTKACAERGSYLLGTAHPSLAQLIPAWHSYSMHSLFLVILFPTYALCYCELLALFCYKT